MARVGDVFFSLSPVAFMRTIWHGGVQEFFLFNCFVEVYFLLFRKWEENPVDSLLCFVYFRILSLVIYY